MERHFETPQPVELYAELDRGDITVTAIQTGESSIRVEGDQPERLRIEQHGDRISAVIERRSLFDFAPRLQVWITVPVGSRAVIKTGSADVATSGALAEAGVTSGSGNVEVAEATGLVRVQTGSGDVRIGTAGEVRVKTGSGDITVGAAAGQVAVQTGSGDVGVGHAGELATLKSASGQIRVDRADEDVVTSTASGSIDLRRVRRGDLNASTASGSVTIGVPPGVPVWTDISTLTGRLDSDLVGAGRPEAGQDHLRIRAKTVSGNVRLVQLAEADVLR